MPCTKAHKSFSMKRIYEPWYTACLSIIIPGLGQFVTGRWILAGVFLLSQISLYVLAYWLSITDRFLGIIPAFIVIILASLCIPFFSAIESFRYVRRFNAASDLEQISDCWFPVFLSWIIGGLGYLYQKKLVYLTIWLGIKLLISIFIKLSYVKIITDFVLLLIVLAHVYIICAKKPLKESFHEIRAFLLFVTVFIFSVATICVFLSHNYAFFAQRGYGTSMEPTLGPGNRTIINNFAYLFEAPKPGDIIAFRTPNWAGQQHYKFLEKRIVAVGGDIVEIKNGQVYVNGELKHWSVLPVVVTKENDYVLNIKPVTVPPNSYYVLGDNIAHSYDSRFFGEIKRDLILGKVVKIYWPLKEAKVIK
jgi:signal peptidase I